MPTTNIITLEDDWLVSADTNYQGYRVNLGTGETIPTGKRVIRKWAALEGIFPEIVRGKTFLDIGCAQGFFLFKALECGAEWATGVERRESYYRALKKHLTPKGPTGCLTLLNKAFPGQMSLLHEDVVLCLSLIHHVFPTYGLDQIFWHLAYCAGETLLVEYPGRADKMVQRKPWLEQHPEYNKEAFEETAKAYFGKVGFVNLGHHNTRWIYRMDK